MLHIWRLISFPTSRRGCVLTILYIFFLSRFRAQDRPTRPSLHLFMIPASFAVCNQLLGLRRKQGCSFLLER